MDDMCVGVTAHRGNSSCFPENTLAAFADGIDCGADWLELDVHLTADSRLVVCHDAGTGRTGDRDRAIVDTALADLQAIDMSAGFRREHSGRDVAPSRIPLLSEVFELVLSRGRAKVSIQPKADCVPQVAALAREMGAEHWIGFNDGSVAKMAAARRLLPEAMVFYDTGTPESPVSHHIATARHYGFDAIVMHHSTMCAESATRIAEAGLQPGVWTVNDPDQMRRFIRMGVVRFYTDCPRVLRAIMASTVPDRASPQG